MRMLAAGVASAALLFSMTIATAGAATLSADDAALRYVAAPGEANFIDVRSELPNLLTIRDQGAPITSTATGCAVILDVAYCLLALTPEHVVLDLGDRGDRVAARASTLTVFGGEGDDVLSGGPRNDVLHGGSGDDLLDGAAGEDDLYGDGGADRLVGASGGDLLDGGLGPDRLIGGSDAVCCTGLGQRSRDIASYASRTVPVQADADGVADDGEAGEGDDIAADVEDLQGGAGDDVLESAPGATTRLLAGGQGDDLLVAGDDVFDERLRGEDGNDELRGGAGHESLEGGEGDDLLTGGDGGDSLKGQAGADRSYGGAGNDEFFRDDDGDDLVDGGPGNDLIYDDRGADTLSGGADHDVLVHRPDGASDDWRGGGGSDRWEGGDPFTAGDGLTVILDELPNDGAPGEGDNVHNDFGTVVGSGRGDVLTGSPGRDGLEGGGGDDVITGLGGMDFLFGGFGDDTLLARDGEADWLSCDEGGGDAAEVDGGLEAQVFGCETLLP